MPTYDPIGHPRLSNEAAALLPSKIMAYADEAEAVFGIAGTDYTGQARGQLVLAVARQVNLSVRLDAAGSGALHSETKGDQSYTVLSHKGQPVMVDPLALEIVRRVLEEAAAVAPEPPLASHSTPVIFTW